MLHWDLVRLECFDAAGLMRVGEVDVAGNLDLAAALLSRWLLARHFPSVACEQRMSVHRSNFLCDQAMLWATCSNLTIQPTLSHKHAAVAGARKWTT